MKLNREISYRTRYSDGGVYGDVCSELAYKLPSIDWIRQPSVLVIHYEGNYYIPKSRLELKGDPCNQGCNPINPYDLEFIEYTLQQVRAECNPRTQYKLPESFIGKNVLVHM